MQQNKHLHTLNNLLDMATGYANCILGSDGCDDLLHILKRPRTIQSVKRIAPVIKTPITNSSIFGCLCAFLVFFCAFLPFFRCFFFSLFGPISKNSAADYSVAYSYKTCFLTDIASFFWGGRGTERSGDSPLPQNPAYLA